MNQQRILATLFTTGALLAQQQAYQEEGRARFAAQVAYDDMATPEIVAMDLGDAPPTIFGSDPVMETAEPQDAVHAIQQELEEERAKRQKLYNEAKQKIEAANDLISKLKSAKQTPATADPLKNDRPVINGQRVTRPADAPPVVEYYQQPAQPVFVQPRQWYYSYPQEGGCVNGQCNR